MSEALAGVADNWTSASLMASLMSLISFSVCGLGSSGGVRGRLEVDAAEATAGGALKGSGSLRFPVHRIEVAAEAGNGPGRTLAQTGFRRPLRCFMPREEGVASGKSFSNVVVGADTS